MSDQEEETMDLMMDPSTAQALLELRAIALAEHGQLLSKDPALLFANAVTRASADPQRVQDVLDAVAAELYEDVAGYSDLRYADDLATVCDQALEDSELELVTCRFCTEWTPVTLAHLHQGKWVGVECWDERLRGSE
jgi:hypothetical protein